MSTPTTITYRIWFISLFILLLSGCATHTLTLTPIPLAQRQQVWKTHLQRLEKLTQFEAKGTFIYYQDNQGKHQASFIWDQYSYGHYQLLILSPFGTTLLKLDVTPQITTLVSQGKTYTANNPETLIYQFTQLKIPFDLLQQWLIGKPIHQTYFKLNQYALLAETRLQQNQQIWQLNIKKYGLYQGIPLPTLLLLKQNERQLQLKINNWSFPPLSQQVSLHE